MERIGVTWNNLVATMGRRIENHGKDAGDEGGVIKTDGH
jgi:hypothetical protein